MPFKMTINYDNGSGFDNPYLWVWYPRSDLHDDVVVTAVDGFSLIYEYEGLVRDPVFGFTFKQDPASAGLGNWVCLDAASNPPISAPSTTSPHTRQVVMDMACSGSRTSYLPNDAIVIFREKGLLRTATAGTFPRPFVAGGTTTSADVAGQMSGPSRRVTYARSKSAEAVHNRRSD